ncbi:hypothetical protein EJ03DRAFT_337216 [Teratosphaeria nubilosa]|uniref:Uncharacterized protein n=1 Tax=Teratosphaeria nubilosa TaxID=161662 RepID=A0A6G1L5G3_9PEZI|nr:hypothetical protein EJ03DRAFT_337216 [Teratosphaeria nubilosa]
MSEANAASTKGHSRVEGRTKRVVVMETDEFEARGKFLDQEQSPLFGMLPRELRDMIWALALAPFEDAEHKFDPTEHYCRPGHTARLKTDYRLLLTCRRIWLEAHAMPMLQAEHSFYYYRAAPDACDPQWMLSLTEKNLQDFGHLHLYCQMYAVEQRLTTTPGAVRGMFLNTLPYPGDFQPRMLHVTLRHTDWYWWEHDAPLELQDDWVKALLNSPDLRSTETLVLEMETLDYKVDQLLPIVERVKSFVSDELETHVVDGKPIKTKFVLTDNASVYEWEGPTNIGKQDFSHYRGKDKLKYHVNTLVWKLKFPDMPGAFIPHLRRAPRIDPRSPSAPDDMAPRLQLAAQDGFRSLAHRHLRDSQRTRVVPGLAQAVEEDRRWDFESAMGKLEVIEWQAKWEREGTLLRFAE